MNTIKIIMESVGTLALLHVFGVVYMGTIHQNVGMLNVIADVYSSHTLAIIAISLIVLILAYIGAHIESHNNNPSYSEK